MQQNKDNGAAGVIPGDRRLAVGTKRFFRRGRAVPGTSLLPIPFAIASAMLVLLAITLTLDSLEFSGRIAMPEWLAVGNLDDARAILAAILGVVSTVLALIFSVTLLVFSMAVSQFGPRLMPYFLRERAMQVALGLFLGTFLYILVTFVLVGQRGKVVFHPELTVLTSVILTFVSFCYLVVYNDRIALTMQTNNMLARIVEDLHSALGELSQSRTGLASHSNEPFASLSDPDERTDALSKRCKVEGGTLKAATSGYVQKIDGASIVEMADELDAFVCLSSRPGEFVIEGEELAHVLPATMTGALEDTINNAVMIGQHRTLEQDVEFAFAQLSEIAIRALSPAVNDTYTGLSSIDYLGDALRMLAALPDTDGLARSIQGRARLLVPPLRFAHVVRAAFDLIRQSASNNPEVCVRLLLTCARLAPQLRDDAQREAIRQEVEAVSEAVKGMSAVHLDRTSLESAYRLACERLAGDGGDRVRAIDG
jgi:uncharacterized membrane protein